MRYALAEGSPPWLSLDSASRTLSGTPDDVSIPPGEILVGVVIGLEASDATGSTTTNATLVVSRGSGPVVRIPFEDQVDKFGPYSAPAGVLVHPSSEFSFEFDPNTFGTGVKGNQKDADKNRDVKRQNGGGQQFNYYAVSGDNAPLPSWISFDAGKLTFRGKTPAFESLVQPPQKFDFQLVASDVVGFASTSINFSIMVGPHELTAEEPVIELNATIGKKLEYTDLPNILKLDKEPLKAENVSSITADGLPPWLSFDEESWAVVGTPDAKAQPTNVTIVVMDKFLDSLNLTMSISFHTKIFISDITGFNVSAGDDFSFDLKKFLFDPTGTEITTEVRPDKPWIRFDDSSKIVSGTVPKSLGADSADNIRITFEATQKHTNNKETKGLDIHVIEIRPTQTPKPDAEVVDNGPNRDWLWFITLPVIFVAVALILAIFWVRRRRYSPRKLDFSEVSGPVPGSFSASSLIDSSSDSIGEVPGAGRQAPPLGPNSYTPAGHSNIRTSQTIPMPSREGGRVTPHAMTLFSGTMKPPQQGNETRSSWFPGRQSRVSPAVTDEVSLLSDTSLGEDVHMIVEDLSPKKLGANMYAKKATLEVPTAAEPFSIQPTPELAYAVAGRYDYVSDDEAPPHAGYMARRVSGRLQNTSSSARGVQHRLSGGWTRGSSPKLSGEHKRHSQTSSSSEATTDTSILTTGFAEEAATATTNAIVKPTVIHIPSRPGEARQVSRRTDDSSTFFGGRSLTKSQRNYGLANNAIPTPAHLAGEYQPSAVSKAPGPAYDGDSAWDHLARNSLGIAYSDLIQTKRATGGTMTGQGEPAIGIAQSQDWNTYYANGNLLSPSRWPKPDAFLAQGDKTDVFRGASEPPQLPPVAATNKGKKRGSFMRGSRGSNTPSPLRTPSAHARNKSRSSRDVERLRISRIREQKALEEFRAMMSSSSQIPSPYNDWAAATAAVSSTRQLPETPSRTSRAPLAERMNESRGLQSTLSKRSVKTARSNKSMRSAWGDDDDEDAWEDIRPPESVVGGWEPERSDGSFPIYI